MKEEYTLVRFLADLPETGLPSQFGVVTACNPNGTIRSADANEQATERLRKQLVDMGITHFPVAGGSLDFSHQELGFGIVLENLGTAVQLGCQFKQDAVFWITEGKVQVVPCLSAGPVLPVGLWHELQYQAGN